MDELEKLRMQIQEERRLREEEQRREQRLKELREAAEVHAEKAEERARASEPVTLPRYLMMTHSLNNDVEVITNPALTTSGYTTIPTGRIFPRQIIPWNRFPEKQKQIWDELSFNPSFNSQHIYPSLHQLDYVRSMLDPISSETKLRQSQRYVVENAVEKLMKETYNDLLLRDHFGLQGPITFEDQYCIYHTSEHGKIPMLAIEYKPPHKLSVEEVITGLSSSEIRPSDEVINQKGVSAETWLVTAVITQLFSYMVGRGVWFGYVCTGEVYIFLRIRKTNPSVYYSVYVPGEEFPDGVQDGDESRVHRTVVAQVFSFVLRALQSPLPSQDWIQAAKALDKWGDEVQELSSDSEKSTAEASASKTSASETSTRKTSRKSEESGSSYEPEKGGREILGRSDYPTRARCKREASETQRPRSDDGDDDEFSPAADRASHRKGKSVVPKATKSSKRQGRGGAQQGHSTSRQSIQDRPYCTHKCLRGLALNGSMDQESPNFVHHGNTHIDRQQFLSSIRHQLAVDRGPDADCVPLYLSGARGSLFKVRLSSHGYTLVAKGVEGTDAMFLCHEKEVYDHIRNLQGEYVPVCVGMVDLIQPYYYDGGVFEHFLFMSYGGEPAFKHIKQSKADVVDEIITAFTALHQHHVLHCDAEVRNLLYDVRIGKFMIVDFERARVRPHQQLGTTGLNKQRWMRNKTPQKDNRDVFTRELGSLRVSLLRYVSRG